MRIKNLVKKAREELGIKDDSVSEEVYKRLAVWYQELPQNEKQLLYGKFLIALFKQATVQKTLPSTISHETINPLQLADGTVVKNLNQLIYALDKMSEIVFKQHVNQYKHDFGEWIENSLGKKSLAKIIFKYKTKSAIKGILLHHIISQNINKEPN